MLRMANGDIEEAIYGLARALRAEVGSGFAIVNLSDRDYLRLQDTMTNRAPETVNRLSSPTVHKTYR